MDSKELKYDLSVLIPARNEMFLAQTVKTVLEKRRGKTEVIVGLDGQLADPSIPEHPDVTVIYSNVPLGQRGMTNQLCRLSKAKYVMKLDAHCDLDEGFDIKMMMDMKDDITLIPTMYNLHAFDWICIGKVPTNAKVKYIDDALTIAELEIAGCGNRIYQGPTPKNCEKCSGNMQRVLIWKKREGKKSHYYRFDKTLHFQYWGAYGSRPEAQADLVEIMSTQGSCFMLTREKYWELDICDENHGSWGQQGVEVAMKTWLSGGRLLVTKKTWYAHMFRTQGGDFGFPYPISTSDQEKARQYSRELWQGNKWDKAIEGRDLEWVLNKFAPVPDWHIPEDKNVNKKPKKGVIYYTDNRLDELNSTFASKVRNQILKGMKEKHIVSASLKPIKFGKNIVLELERGYITMAKQILAALKESDADVIFFCEHDVLYHPSHFDFIPAKKDVYYYNTNVWRIRDDKTAFSGTALWTDDLQQLSGLVAWKDTLIKHFEKRVQLLEHESKSNPEGFNKYVRQMGFEPGTHGRPERVDDLKSENYKSALPNLDIRHGNNLTPSRWNKEQYRNEKYTRGWTEKHVSEIEGWKMDENGIIVSIWQLPCL